MARVEQLFKVGDEVEATESACTSVRDRTGRLMVGRVANSPTYSQPYYELLGVYGEHPQSELRAVHRTEDGAVTYDGPPLAEIAPATDDGWWDVDPEANVPNVDQLAGIGLEVRVQLRRKP